MSNLHKGVLSELGHNVRTLARRGEIGIPEAVQRIKFLDQSIDAALDLALEEYERNPYAQLREVIGDLYVNAGQHVVAESIFKGMHADGENIHVTNLIYAGIPATKALIDPNRKILFIPIPKCGSSTVKNYFTQAIYGRNYRETVHFHHPELYHNITPDQMHTDYSDYFRFAITRDPIDRLVSYYARNVTAPSLRREALSQLEFMGYPTKPGPRQFATMFHQFRQYFKDFRHHTDPICGYLDPFDGTLDKIYTMADLPQIRERLGEIYGCVLDDDRSMVSKGDAQDKDICRKAASQLLTSWYARDYEAYPAG